MRQKSELRSQRSEGATDSLQSGEHPAPAGPACRFRQLAESWDHGFTLPKQRERFSAFTLAELLVTMGVLVLVVFLFTQLLNSAATITIVENKRMDADSEARQVFDRLSLDFAQMVKRTDVDYFVKNTTQLSTRQQGNDQLAFYSAVPGYYPSSGAPSPVSLVAYRVNSTNNKLERLGKGLVWNGVSTTNTPMVFLPLTISNTWPYATNQNPDPAYEVIGPDVIRFEYFYKVTNGFLTDCVTGPSCSVNGWQSVSAIVVDIAVIDPKSKVLLYTVDPSGVQLKRLNGADGSSPLLQDFTSDPTPGKFITLWQSTLNTTTILPRQVLSGIRVYERYFYLNH